MVADENNNIKKCGEISINVTRARNRNNKMYRFNCTLCECICDQLKKFTLHLEEKHFPKFIADIDIDENLQPDIKSDETDKKEFKTNDIKENITSVPEVGENREDPLETSEFINTIVIIEELPEIKVETETNCNEQNSEAIPDFDNDDMEYEDCIDNCDDDSDEDFKPTKKKQRNKTIKKDCDLSDLGSDYSNEENFEKKSKKSKVKGKKKTETNDIDVDDKELAIALLEAFKKQTVLWDLKERTTVKDISQRCFETIANEVNEKLKYNITWTFAKLQIFTMRRECSHQLEKQRNGEEHQIPWYFEHMEYLQENIDYMIKERNWKFGRRVKKLDHSKMPTIIELYKKYEDLWQVKNIHFGIAAKKDEAFKKIVEDLKKDYNFNLTTDNLLNYIKYINRYYSKDKEEELKSELEKTEFKPSFQYYKELSFLRDSLGPFKCATCNEIIQRYEHYHIHVAAHNNTKPFNCTLCPMGFKTFDTHVKHAKRHLGINSFPCKVCGKIYPLKTELERHLIGHTGAKPYLCQICGSSFRVSRDYDNHIRRHEKRFRYECHICKHGFNQLVSLNDHVKSHLKIRDNFCDVCGKGFTTEKYLKNHKQIHAEVKRFKCDECPKEYAQLAGLRQHRKTHRPQMSASEKKRQKQESLMSSECFDVKI